LKAAVGSRIPGRGAIEKWSSAYRSAAVVNRLGEDEDRIYNVGCPSIDIADDVAENANPNYDPQDEYSGVGEYIDVTKDYIVVQYHPVPTQYQSEYDKTWELIEAVDQLDIQTFWFWPNMDAGTDKVSKAIREYRDQRDPEDIRFYINMRPTHYLTMVNNSVCLLGNSSVGIRECSRLGQPSVNIGDRQTGRERGPNVIDVPCETDAIVDTVETQIGNGGYKPSSLYGDGDGAEKMVDAMSDIDFELKGSMDPTRLGLNEIAPTVD